MVCIRRRSRQVIQATVIFRRAEGREYDNSESVPSKLGTLSMKACEGFSILTASKTRRIKSAHTIDYQSQW